MTQNKTKTGGAKAKPKQNKPKTYQKTAGS